MASIFADVLFAFIVLAETVIVGVGIYYIALFLLERVNLLAAVAFCAASTALYAALGARVGLEVWSWLH